MMPPPSSSRRVSAKRSWSPQSQRREPKTSPVRHAECSRNGIGREKSGLPTTTAVEYYNAGFGHYFMTAQADEIVGLDGGAFGGAFTRTLRTFSVFAGPGTDYKHPLMAHSVLAHTLYQYLGTPLYHKRAMVDTLYPRKAKSNAA